MEGSKVSQAPPNGASHNSKDSRQERGEAGECPREAPFPVSTQSGMNQAAPLARTQNLGVLVGAPSSERVWHRLCSKRAGPVLPFQKDEARLVLLPNPSPPSLLVMDLHLSFEQLVPGTHRALLGSPPSKGSLQVPPTKGSAQGPPFLPQQLLC